MRTLLCGSTYLGPTQGLRAAIAILTSKGPPIIMPANLVCQDSRPPSMNSLVTVVKCSKSKKPSLAWDGSLCLG